MPLLRPGASIDLYSAVTAGELDAAIIVTPPFVIPKTRVVTRLRLKPLLFISNQATTQSIKQQLMSNAYIRYDPLAWGGRFAQQYVLDQQLEPRLLCDLDGLEAITLMMAQGLGVSLIPEWSGCNEYAARVNITAINGTKYRRDITLITRQPSVAKAKIHLLSALLTGNANNSVTASKSAPRSAAQARRI